MAKEKSCCFTGHRILGDDFNEDLLARGIEYLINQGVDTFICGGALGFDTVAAETVLRIRKKQPHIRLHIYAPCNDQSHNWRREDRKRYDAILKKADYVHMPDVPYYTDCMKERNYKMVDDSVYCICYLNNTRSGTGQTCRYAQSRGLTIYNIARRK